MREYGEAILADCTRFSCESEPEGRMVFLKKTFNGYILEKNRKSGHFSGGGDGDGAKEEVGSA